MASTTSIFTNADTVPVPLFSVIVSVSLNSAVTSTSEISVSSQLALHIINEFAVTTASSKSTSCEVLEAEKVTRFL